MAFILSILLFFFSGALLPDFKMVPFAPLLALLLRKNSLISLLWWAILTGLIADATSTYYRFGLSAFVNMMAILALFPFRRQLYEDKPIPFISLNFLISLICSFQFSLLSLYKGAIVFPNFIAYLKELFLSSFLDALIGFAFLFIPLKLYAEIKKRGIKKLFRLSEET